MSMFEKPKYIVTREGLKKVEDELLLSKTALVAKIKESRTKVGLCDNVMFIEAKREQVKLEGKIRRLEQLLLSYKEYFNKYGSDINLK